MLEQQGLVYPEKDEIINECNRIQDWHTARICEHGPKNGEIGGVDIRGLDFSPSIYFLKFTLGCLFGVKSSIYLRHAVGAISVPASQKTADDGPEYLGTMLGESLQGQCYTKS